ncbi:MAG: hypothetical protein WC413_03345 [Candidatus Nanoarchaeia archaeon]
MQKNYLIVLIIFLLLLAIFFFPKPCKEGFVQEDAIQKDCKCLGIKHAFSSINKWACSGCGWKTYCLGIPYSYSCESMSKGIVPCN